MVPSAINTPKLATNLNLFSNFALSFSKLDYQSTKHVNHYLKAASKCVGRVEIGISWNISDLNGRSI